MGQIKVSGNEYRQLVVHPVELPDAQTPWTQLPLWFRRYVLPRLDTRKKWMGCWMWTGGHDKGHEPRMSHSSLKREGGRVGKRKTFFVKSEMIIQFNLFDTSNVPRRVWKGNVLKDVPDLDVRHLCGNPSCLNPNHWIVCLDDPKQHDIEKLRDKYLVPGSYWNGAPR